MTLQTKEKDPKEDLIRINGFQQLLDMLKIADHTFRESILKRIAQKDLNLAASLEKRLKNI